MSNLSCSLLPWSTFSFGDSFCLCSRTSMCILPKKREGKTYLSVHRPPFFPCVVLVNDAKSSVARLRTRPSSIEFADDRQKYVWNLRLHIDFRTNELGHVFNNPILSYYRHVQSRCFCVHSRYHRSILLRAVSRRC